MTELAGKSIGRYHILEQLGEGGMATVYKAFDLRLEAEVAVKVIRTDSILPRSLERAVKRFDREAKALAKLTHPNIVKVLDYGDFEGRPFIVMPYLKGGTLKQILGGRPMPWQDAARLLIPVAKALDFAHRQGLIHRDVKPSNIIVTEDGDPMLTDFGIAKFLDQEDTLELTGTQASVGTPDYMAPEQSTSRTTDHRADIYSLGVVYYEMVTGRKPFIAETPMAVLIKHASEPLPRPNQFIAGLPKEVEQLLIKSLAKKPADRYQSMREMGAALEKLLSGSSKVRSARFSVSWRWVAVACLLIIGAWASVRLASRTGGAAISSDAVAPSAVPATSVVQVPSSTKTITEGSPTSPPDIALPPTLISNPDTPSASTSLLFDDFSDTAHDGVYDLGRWNQEGECGDVKQTEGVLVFSGRGKGCDLIMRVDGIRYLSLSEAKTWFQADTKLENDHSGGVVTQEIQFITNDLPGGNYWILCGIIQSQGSPSLFFDVVNVGVRNNSDYRIDRPAQTGQWYQIRLQIDPEDMRISCMVDGKVLGSHIPRDAILLRDARFKRIIEGARLSDGFVTGMFDNIEISQP